MPVDQCSTFNRADIAVQLIGERAGDVGVDLGDGHQDLGRVTVGHHEPGVGKRADERPR